MAQVIERLERDILVAVGKHFEWVLGHLAADDVGENHFFVLVEFDLLHVGIESSVADRNNVFRRSLGADPDHVRPDLSHHCHGLAVLVEGK